MDDVIELLELMRTTGQNYLTRKSSPVPSKVNVFTIVSDQYQKENFHSDLLKFLLEQRAEHNDEDWMLGRFLDLLIKCRPNCIFKNRNAVKVYREQGRIDISLVEDHAKQVVIIENKINGAVDQHKQLLRYYNYYNDQGYDVLGILYLSLDGGKRPDFSLLTIEELNIVVSKTFYLAAYHANDIDLYKNWLLPSLTFIKGVDI